MKFSEVTVRSIFKQHDTFYECTQVLIDINSDTLTIFLKDIFSKEDSYYSVRLDVNSQDDIKDYSLEYVMFNQKVHNIAIEGASWI